MKSTHQIVKIRIDVVKDDPANPVYIASNDELGVFVKGASFRAVMLDLREILALRLKNNALSLHFYSPDSPPVLPGAGSVPGAALTPEHHIN